MSDKVSSSVLSLHVWTTKPTTRFHRFEDFQCAEIAYGTHGVSLFMRDGGDRLLAAALRELAHQIDNGRPVSKESR